MFYLDSSANKQVLYRNIPRRRDLSKLSSQLQLQWGVAHWWLSKFEALSSNLSNYTIYLLMQVSWTS